MLIPILSSSLLVVGVVVLVVIVVLLVAGIYGVPKPRVSYKARFGMFNRRAAPGYT